MFLIRKTLFNTINLKNNLNIFNRHFTENNILALRERGFFNEIFPDNAGFVHLKLIKSLCSY